MRGPGDYVHVQRKTKGMIDYTPASMPSTKSGIVRPLPHSYVFNQLLVKRIGQFSKSIIERMDLIPLTRFVSSNRA